MEADLSSRTPFVRMWTSVKIIEAGEVVEDIDTVVVNTEDEDLLKEYKNSSLTIADVYQDIVEFTEDYTFVSRSRKKLKINLLGIG